MSYYRHHAFFCCNQKPNGKVCCQNHDAEAMYRYAKDKCRQLGVLGAGNITITQTRCLGRCALGPIMVVYPQEVWYRWQSKEDIDDIINSHLLNNIIVKRLKISNTDKATPL